MSNAVAGRSGAVACATSVGAASAVTRPAAVARASASGGAACSAAGTASDIVFSKSLNYRDFEFVFLATVPRSGFETRPTELRVRI